jgi:hypothetical protein
MLISTPLARLHFHFPANFTFFDPCPPLRCRPNTLALRSLYVEARGFRRLVPRERHHPLFCKLGIAKFGHPTVPASIQCDKLT